MQQALQLQASISQAGLHQSQMKAESRLLQKKEVSTAEQWLTTYTRVCIHAKICFADTIYDCILLPMNTAAAVHQRDPQSPCWSRSIS